MTSQNTVRISPRQLKRLASRPSSTKATETDLILQVAAGNRTSFELLWTRHQAKVKRRIWSVLDNPVDIEDAMQETAIKAFLRTTTFKFRASYSTWLCQIATNTSLNMLRTNHQFVDGVALMYLQASRTEEPDYDVHSQQVLHQLDQAMKLLGKCYRDTLSLNIAGHDFTSVGLCTGVGPGTVRSRMARARQQIRASFLHSFGDDKSKNILTL